MVQELSLARDLATVMAIVRDAARALTGADGATFVLRDGDMCYYADESAIAPLWKGRRFPLSACISGWVMIHGRPVAIEDIYADPRIPAEAYRPTFVKSLAMVPIRAAAPIGAIGIYWATMYRATPRDLSILEALAGSTSVAMENVEVRAELERRVEERTRELRAKNRALSDEHEALVALAQRKGELCTHVVHDLKSPAAAIILAASMGLDAEGLSAPDRRRWSCVLSSAEHIHRTALELLDIASCREGKLVPAPAPIDVGALFAEILAWFRPRAERREQTIEVREDVPEGALRADPQLVRRVLQNLVDNAVRHGPRCGTLRLEAHAGGGWVQFDVCDEGRGIAPHLRDRVFEPYARLGAGDEPETGQGLGLTFCRLAVEAHGGRIWIEDNEPRGCRFCVRLPAAPSIVT